MNIKLIFIFCVLLLCHKALANLKYHPISFVLSTAQDSYYEGERITLQITITNNDKEKSHPVLLSHTQNTGQKLFFLNVYDRANNTLLLRYTEDRMLKMMVSDTGRVQITILKPLEQIVLPIYLNHYSYLMDGDKYNNYLSRNESHHDFGVPLFAGHYKVSLCYNPNGILLGDSIYSYYGDFDKNPVNEKKLLMHEEGIISQMIDLKIKRSAASTLWIGKQKYFIKQQGNLFFYFSEDVKEIVTDSRCHHISNLPADSFVVANEYFYSHFTDMFAEGILRFADGDIRFYRKYRDSCPADLFTEKYNDHKQKIYFACQLADKSFYQVTYHQPGGRIQQESYCSQDGTLCNVINYIYNEQGELLRKDVSQGQPCLETELDQKKGNKRFSQNPEDLK